MSPPPLMMALFLLFVLYLPPVPVPSILLHLVPTTAFLRLLLQPHVIPTHLPSFGIIGITLTRPRSVVHRVLGLETSWLAGGYVFSTCRFQEFFSGLSPGQAIFQMISSGLWGLCLGFPT